MFLCENDDSLDFKRFTYSEVNVHYFLTHCSGNDQKIEMKLTVDDLAALKEAFSVD